MSRRMHDDEVAVTTALVKRLLHDQFPEWRGLPLERIDSGGTVNTIYRLGADLAVRLPLAAWGVAALEREFAWAPRLAPHLPLRVPEPVTRGKPGAGYPFPWSVYRWLSGQMATGDRLSDLAAAAIDLAGFVNALQEIDPAGGPPNTHRGVPLATADASTRKAITLLDGTIDREGLVAAWDRALLAPAWDRGPVWIHGDLWYSNLLAEAGRITAVIDFGGVGIGDPAIDLLPAWSVLDARTRLIYRAELGVDDATWERGRGWAVSMAALALPFYAGTNPVIVGNSRRMITEVLSGA